MYRDPNSTPPPQRLRRHLVQKRMIFGQWYVILREKVTLKFMHKYGPYDYAECSRVAKRYVRAGHADESV